MTLGKQKLAARMAAAATLITVAACGGSPSSPSGGGSNSVVVNSTGSVGAVGATVTIGSNGAVSPSQVSIAVGQSVTFTNNDSRAHDMSSDPHPSHGNCPSLGNVGVVQPGQSKTSFGFANGGTCGYHDHNNPESAGLQGRIVVQ